MLNSTALTGYERDGFIPAVDVMSAEEALALRQALDSDQPRSATPKPLYTSSCGGAGCFCKLQKGRGKLV